MPDSIHPGNEETFDIGFSNKAASGFLPETPVVLHYRRKSEALIVKLLNLIDAAVRGGGRAAPTGIARLGVLVAAVLAWQGAAPFAAAQALDFQAFKTKVEPVFLKKRESGLMCYTCHSEVKTRLRLQHLSPGHTTWTEEQSKLNFEAVSQLVTPGDPTHSRLLLHPLAPDAGGDPVHTGGKFWKSQSDPEWQSVAEWVRSGHAEASASSASTTTLDFEFFRTKVEPIFLRKRPGLARCYVCHEGSGTAMRLQRMAKGSTTWTEEQSRRNFQTLSQIVIPGDPTSSRLLMHPLSPEGGGDPFHGGGRQFESQNDPDWQTMAAWVKGQKADSSSK